MKVYDSQGRLKVVGFTGPPGTQSVTCAELSATASLLSVAINVVSDGLSDLRSAHDVLSNRVSVNSAVATGSVTSAEVQVASAAATSADAHANTASAAATSVDSRVTSVNTFLASISARSVGVSAKGLQSAINAVSNTISNELSARAASVQTASAAATSADAHANTVSARVVSVSAELASLIQIASAAATSADGHANTVSARAVSISAELASLVQIASAAATSADAHANTASAAATSVDGRIASLSAFFASLSGRSVGDVSAHGLQSIINALSNRISATTGGTGSVTSTELSAAVEGLKFLNLTNEDNADASAGSPVFLATSAASAFHLATNTGNPGDQEAVGLVTSLIAQTSTGVVQTRGVLSLTSAQWDDRTGQTGGLTIGSKYYVGIAGLLTVTPPASPAFIRPVGIAIAATKMWINPGLVDDFGPFLASISALSTNGISTKGLQSVINTLSGKIDFASNAASIADVHASTASAAATSANAHANTVSGRVVSVSAELASLVQIASAAATSADGHANTASAAATSADAHANTVSARVVSVSAELASLVQIASAAATSADGHADTVSAALSADYFISLQNVDTVSLVYGMPVQIGSSANTMLRAGAGIWNQNSVQGAGLVADTAIAVSAVGRVRIRGRMVFTSTQLRSVNGGNSAIAPGLRYFVGNTGAITFGELNGNVGLARVGVGLDERTLLLQIGGNPSDQNLSNQISVLSQGLSVLSSKVTSINSALSNVSTRSTGDVSTRGLQSALDALSNRISGVVAGAASVTSTELSAVANASTATSSPVLSNAISAVNVVSARAVSISAELASLVQIASAAATSADGHANTVSARAVSISAELASLVQIASLAATSADGHANTVSARAVSISAELASLVNIVSARAVSISAELASLVNIVSARVVSVSAELGSLLASTSAQLRTDITSTSAVIKADIASVSAAIIANVSAQYGAGQFKMVSTGTQAIATATFTKVSGLSLSIVGSGFYEIHGQLVWTGSGQGSASAIFNFGMSMTAQPVMAAFRMMGNQLQFGAVGQTPQVHFAGNSAICGTPSVMYSVKASIGASGSAGATMFFDGVLQASTAQSQLKVVVATSTAAFGIAIQPGSYIRAYKIG